MKTLNKIILTSLIGAGSLGIFGEGYGQTQDTDSVFRECNTQIKINDSLEQSRLLDDFTLKLKTFFPEYFLERIYSDSLVININDGIYHVTNKNEEQGIEDIRKINNGYEDAWLYLPEKQIWYEIGIHSDSESVKPFNSLIEKALEENSNVKELIFYHNHPEEGYDWPSFRDLSMAVYDNFVNPLGYKIVDKIIAKEGLVEYSLNSKGKKLLENKLIDEIGGYAALNDLEDISEYFDINCVEYKK